MSGPDERGAGGRLHPLIDPADRDRWLRALRFPPELERDFQAGYWQQYRRLLRATALLFILLALAAAARDADGGAAYVLAMDGSRLVTFICLYALTFSRVAERFWQPAYVAGACLAFISMLRVAGDTAAYAEATIPSVAVRTVVLQLWGACALTLVLVTFSVVRLQVGWSALLQTVILAAGLAAAAVRMRMPPSSLTFAAGPMLLVVILNLATAYTHERLQRSDYLSHWELERERARSEAVLRNVLPAAIAERLKSGEAGIADDHPAVTVLFADIVDFTPWAGSRPAREVVEYLNEVFSRFDRLVEAHGLEKLKTIGDAYLAVAGAPLPRADHVEAAARLALAMQADLASLNLAAAAPLQLRIGIHTGPLVAGVLGEKRFQYDVWGDTVNTASRLEAQGLPGAIQVSSEVARQLQGAFVLTRRQQIEIKGKGPMTTYLLEGEVVEREDARPNSG